MDFHRPRCRIDSMRIGLIRNPHILRKLDFLAATHTETISYSGNTLPSNFSSRILIQRFDI
ncbi:hypothetical protein MT1254_00935 [Micrococcus luteus]|nr:hypothetical protein MT1254_00935 [Micrococcus luteus]